MFVLMKLLHIVAVIAFLGSIMTGLFWHMHASRARDPRLLAFTMYGIIRSGRLFTMPGVIVVVATGIATAVIGGLPLLHTGWVLWSLVLFLLAGVIFMGFVAPLQRQLLALALAHAGSPDSFDYPAYASIARRWEILGVAALVTLVTGLVLMVLKPAL